VVKEGPVARKILEHLGLPTEVAAATPYRPEHELWDWNFVPLRGTGPPEDLDQRSPDLEWDQRTASDLEASF
jgi:hypothetical protein